LISTLGRHLRSNIVAYVALFIALGGTAVAVGGAIRSGDIVNGQVKTQDLHDGAVTPSKLSDDAHGFASVAADGTLQASRGVKQVAQANLAAGVYCFDLTFKAKAAVASANGTSFNDAAEPYVKTAIPADNLCPAGLSDASVRVEGGSTTAPFFVIFG
jgi:hypothetical protein